jgi:hypothetical protein
MTVPRPNALPALPGERSFLLHEKARQYHMVIFEK